MANMENYMDEEKTTQISLESRQAFRLCMNTEAIKLGAPVGLISAIITNSVIRYKATYIKTMAVLTSGLIGYTFGRFLYAPVCAKKYVPEWERTLQNRRLELSKAIDEAKATKSETPWIEQEPPILNDYYTNTDDDRNQFGDISNDVDIDDKPINLKPQKQSVTYEDLRRQHRASLYNRMQSHNTMDRETSRLPRDEELLEDVATSKTEKTEENMWF